MYISRCHDVGCIEEWEKVLKLDPDIIVIVITGFGKVELAVEGIKEGATLDDIEWAITENPKDGEEQVRVILSGTFHSGPSLIAKVPSEWSNKPLSIHCGALGLKRE